MWFFFGSFCSFFSCFSFFFFFRKKLVLKFSILLTSACSSSNAKKWLAKVCWTATKLTKNEYVCEPRVPHNVEWWGGSFTRTLFGWAEIQALPWIGELFSTSVRNIVLIFFSLFFSSVSFIMWTVSFYPEFFSVLMFRHRLPLPSSGNVRKKRSQFTKKRKK